MATEQKTCEGLRELALFAGAGGGILGGKLLGWRTVCAVEWDQYAASVLVARQNDECLPPFPIWDDVQTFDGRPWRGIVDVVSGGFPCQDISSAGKGAGIEGQRSGMWKHMARIVGEVGPRFVFVENSPLLVGRGLARVLADLAALGYDARWGVVGAHHAGAPHRRDRIWIVADAVSVDCNQRGTQSTRQLGEARFANGGNDVADAASKGLQRAERQRVSGKGGLRKFAKQNWWATEPGVGGMVDGLASAVDPHGANAVGNVDRVAKGISNRVDRLKCLGNGQVPHAAKLAWEILTQQK